MLNLNNRLERLETIHAPKKELPSAWVAMIAVDGKVKLTHAKHGTIHLNNRDELQEFILDHGLDKSDEIRMFIIEIENSPAE